MKTAATRTLASLVAAALAALALVPAAMPARATTSARTHERTLTMTPRLQWDANFGYCGETSFVTAGLQSGQYTSQWTARSLASPGVPQTSEDSQLLLGVNDLAAAAAMRLSATRYSPDAAHPNTARGFLSWVRDRFVSGDTVAIGVFNNTTLLDEPGMGDPTYDHIVPVYGWKSTGPLTSDAPVRGSDVVTFSDNGLATLTSPTPYLYSYRVDRFPATRREVHGVHGPLYGLPLTKPRAFYGTAIAGPLDPAGVLVPVRLAVSTRGEGRQEEPAMSAPPAGRPMTLTADLPHLDPSVRYRVYLYTDFSKVPVRDFNAHASDAARSWDVPVGMSSFQVSMPGVTSGTYVFRAVPVAAS